MQHEEASMPAASPVPASACVAHPTASPRFVSAEVIALTECTLYPLQVQEIGVGGNITKTRGRARSRMRCKMIDRQPKDHEGSRPTSRAVCQTISHGGGASKDSRERACHAASAKESADVMTASNSTDESKL